MWAPHAPLGVSFFPQTFSVPYSVPGTSSAEGCKHDPHGALLSLATEAGLDTQSHSTRVPLTPSPKKTSLLALSSENAETRSTWEGEWECLPRGPSYVWSQLTFYTLCIFGPGGLMSSASVARTHAALCYWPRLCGTLEGPHSVPVLGALFLYSILSLHLLLPCSVPGG